MKSPALTILMAIWSLLLYGQDFPVFQLSATNPMLYNPANAGQSDRPVIVFSRRQQWTSFPGAPVTNYLQFHSPVKKQVLLGLSFASDERSALKSTSALLTGGYRVKLAPRHYLAFAISGGAAFNRIDPDAISDLEGNDPALSYILQQSAQLLGNAGISYRNQGFRLGFALPELFRNANSLQSAPEMGSFDPLKRFTISASWRIPVSENLDIEPLIIYHSETWRSPGIETAATAYLYSKIWLGGGYRTDIGGTAYLGLEVLDHMQFTYGYGLAPGTMGASGFFQYSTHELQVALLIGKEKADPEKAKKYRKTYTRSIPPARQPVQKEAVTVNPAGSSTPTQTLQITETATGTMPGKTGIADSTSTPAPAFQMPPESPAAPRQKTFTVVEPRRKPRLDYRRDEDINVAAEMKQSSALPAAATLPVVAAQINPDSLVRIPQINPEGKYEGPAQLNRGNHMLELDEGHYVVIGVFRTFAQAEEYSDKMFREGHFTKYGYASETKMYFVYIYRSRDYDQAMMESERLRRLGLKFRENTVLSIK